MQNVERNSNHDIRGKVQWRKEEKTTNWENIRSRKTLPKVSLFPPTSYSPILLFAVLYAERPFFVLTFLSQINVPTTPVTTAENVRSDLAANVRRASLGRRATRKVNRKPNE